MRALLAILLFGMALETQARTEHVALHLNSGRIIAARLEIPDDNRARLPALMLFGGFRGAARTLDLVHADVPVILASFDYPFDPPRKFRFPASLKEAPAMRAAVRETLEGIHLLALHLRARNDVDPQRISLAGASAGAPFAVIAGQRESIDGIVLVQGFGQLRDVVAHQLVRRWEPRHGSWVRHPARWLSSAVLAYLGPPSIEDHARRMSSGQRVLLLTANADDFIPPAATESLWRSLEESKARTQRIELDGVHLRGAEDPAVADIMRRAVEWMAAERLL